MTSVCSSDTGDTSNFSEQKPVISSCKNEKDTKYSEQQERNKLQEITDC